jgi:hypothetical protein
MLAMATSFLKMMKYAVIFWIGHANSELARIIWLPCPADLPISYIGQQESVLLTF